ncbi:PAAR-like protein [uncultured Zobellia sp.]|uniref:PAAR-like protein n=1 Tax=uncultured Zobellia sp. TaxID=255433 RepID=UPI002595D649|nr:PAAR-like protein [uncultured Zobellia sp.]
MANKKYVPQGTYLACDKGTVPVEFKITNNNNTFLFDEPVANTGDMVPMLNVMPMGVCTVTSSACVPAPVMWDGFEDGIFVGLFNPLLEDSVLPCGVGGKIEIFYSLEEATAACAEEESSFWETLGKVVLVVAAVALIVVTGGMAIAAIGAVAAASGALATGIAVTVAALEVAGCLLTVKALYDYSQDGDEEALFKEVALGFLFLGAGKVIEKGFSAWSTARAAKLARQKEIHEQVMKALDPNGAGDNVLRLSDDLIEASDDGIKGADELFDPNHPYKHLDDGPSVGQGKDFTAAQKKKIYDANRKRNGGVLKDDDTGEILIEAQKSKKGVTPPQNEAQVDHIIPKKPDNPDVTPGSNSYENAKVISRKNNRAKSNKTGT